MSKNHNNHNGRPEKQNEAAGKVEQEVKQQTEINDVTDDADAESLETAEEAQNADLQNQLDAARAEIEKDRNDYLLLMAEFDNYPRIRQSGFCLVSCLLSTTSNAVSLQSVIIPTQPMKEWCLFIISSSNTSRITASRLWIRPATISIPSSMRR